MKNLALTLSVLIGLTITSCKNTDAIGVINDEKKVTIDSMKVVAEKQRIIDSMKLEATKVAAQKEVVYLNQNGNSSTATTTTMRIGWSGAAKGAVIGAGVGAATGAIVSKKKGQGAIIGGLAGAGVGAGTGAIIDDRKKQII